MGAKCPFRRRCDLVGFVNGLPLVFIELKRHDKGLKAAFDDNYTDYKDTIPHLFHYNALVIVSSALVPSPVAGITSIAEAAQRRRHRPGTQAR